MIPFQSEILDAASVLHRLVAAEDFPVAVPCDIQVMAILSRVVKHSIDIEID